MSSLIPRAQAIWRELFAEQRIAAIAAAGLLVSLLLPWYTETAVEGGRKTTVSLNPFQSWGFVELAIALVALGVLTLVLARGERRAFHLPFGDGIVILAGGAWVVFLVFYRSVDSPGDGVTWGLLVAFVLAALMAGAGWRMHARHRPEPLVDGDDPRTVRLEGDPGSVAPREEPGTALTRVAHPEEQPTRPIPPDERPTRPLPTTGSRRRPGGRRRSDGQFEGQMSFDDPDG
jgi:hypothetical protein